MKQYNTVGMTMLLLFLVAALVLVPENPSYFLNIVGLVIVIGGVLVAACLSYSPQEVWESIKRVKTLAQVDDDNLYQDITRLTEFSKLWFRNQDKIADQRIAQVDDEFLRKGLQMVRDREDYDDMMSMLNLRISQYRARANRRISLFKSMATYAPAFGLLGSLVGLINMLNSMALMSGAAQTAAVMPVLSSHLATALVTTMYGLLLANLVLKPIATKLEHERQHETMRLSMLAEGISMIAQERTPAAIQDTLLSFAEPQQVVPPKPEKPKKVSKADKEKMAKVRAMQIAMKLQRDAENKALAMKSGAPRTA